ncbi:hypothetical protein DM558_06330 [Entomomonas moraniae]|uniref:Uncharacterized protein n=1 Tax=Entomomonas moraniae TaxID=2213226 RepID=A0A3S9XDB9_9GAMM|nr:hypothetical protein [Entomomonas moraniae]AZS50415.1 hypothetical protein DM558_06330 [Entomomonas moraniae]
MNNYTKLMALIMPAMAVRDIEMMNSLINEELTQKPIRSRKRAIGSAFNELGIMNFKNKKRNNKEAHMCGDRWLETGSPWKE